jgi:5-(carboxyamino)imidazole ribonucleotide mutase
MPFGIPVATVALNAAKNAGILAAQILATSNNEVSDKLYAFKQELQKGVDEKVFQLLSAGWSNSFDSL